MQLNTESLFGILDAHAIPLVKSINCLSVDAALLWFENLANEVFGANLVVICVPDVSNGLITVWIAATVRVACVCGNVAHALAEGFT